MIVRNHIEIRKTGIQEPLGFKLLVNPVVASAMDQECGGLCDCNPESFECLEVTNFSFKLELIILRLNDRCYEVWMWNVVVLIFVRPASIPLGLGEDMRARACRMPETNSIFTGVEADLLKKIEEVWCRRGAIQQ